MRSGEGAREGKWEREAVGGGGGGGRLALRQQHLKSVT